MATTKIRSSNQLYIDNTLDVNGYRITNLALPTGSTDAVNKAYVDAIQTGLDIKESVRATTTSNLVVTTGSTTLTNAGTLAPFSIDGVTGFTVGTRVLIKDQINSQFNGIYTVTTVGTASVPWVLTRAFDFDNTPGVEVTSGAFCFVEEGTTYADSGWVLTTNNPITIGTTPLTFTQFSGAGQINAGFGLTKSGNTLNVVSTGNGSLTITEDSVNLTQLTINQTTSGTNTKFYDSISVDAYGRVTATNIASLPTGSTSIAGIARFDDGDFDVTANGLVTLNTQTLTPGSYGSTTAVPVVGVNNNGIITGITSTTISTTLNISGDTGSDEISLLNDTLNIKGANGVTTSVNSATNTLTISGTPLSTYDARYINVTGDTMTGALVINSNLTVTGTTSLNATRINETYNLLLAGDNKIILNDDGAISHSDIYATYDGTNGSVLRIDTPDGVILNDKIVATSFVKSGGTSDQYLMADGSVTTTAQTQTYYDSRYVNVTGDTTNYLIVTGSSGSGGNGIEVTNGIQGSILKSTVSTGTAPIEVQSTTLVTNLNADLLDGLNASQITANTITYSDARYVNVTGDTMTGTLNIKNIQTTGTTDTVNLYTNLTNGSIVIGNDIGTGSTTVYGGNVVIGAGGTTTLGYGSTTVNIGENATNINIAQEGSVVNVGTPSFNSTLNMYGAVNITGNTKVIGNITGTTFVKNGGTNDQILMADGSVTRIQRRKYRLKSTSASGSTVVFSFSGINSGNIVIDTDSYELFRNGLLQNNDPSNDYTVTAPNYTSDTITFTVNPDVINDSFPDIFLLNFSYTYA